MTCQQNVTPTSLPLDVRSTHASTGVTPVAQTSLHLQVGAVVNINNGLLSKEMKTMFAESILQRNKGEDRVLPTAFLFNDVGLQIWSQITQSPTYHQTKDEIKLLESYGEHIASHIIAGSTLLDIGAG
jgi:uncharacterized SAM-dependent methyltransferase